jgi:tRNA pseudouridine55 synthase
MKYHAKHHGWLIVDKPEGLSSNQVLGRIRYRLGRPKAGFAGTLDPLATGVLPIAFGEATKLIDRMVDVKKSYAFTVRWGVRTETDDLEGLVVETNDHRPTRDDILKALPSFVGEITQVPPLYSAVKIQGKRACDRVRNAEEITLKARQVVVDALDLVDVIDSDHATFQVTCGKGTYVRSLARDLGEALGTSAHVTKLSRESVGPFSKGTAVSFDKLLEGEGEIDVKQFMHPIERVLDDIPAISIDAEAVKKIRHGQSISCPLVDPSFLGEIPLYDDRHQLIAMSIIKGNRVFPSRVFVY